MYFNNCHTTNDFINIVHIGAEIDSTLLKRCQLAVRAVSRCVVLMPQLIDETDFEIIKK